LPHTASDAQQDKPEFQIDADLAYQERIWRAQRIGWLVFVALIIAALIGLLGPGPLSSTSAGAPADGLWIEYDRFARQDAPTTIVLHADRRLARGDEIGLVLSGDAVRGLELTSTTPPADGSGVAHDGVVLRFRTDRQPGTLTIVLHVKPQRMGLHSSRIGLAGGPAYDIRQWIFP
jgi:hypothetical protein